MKRLPVFASAMFLTFAFLSPELLSMEAAKAGERTGTIAPTRAVDSAQPNRATRILNRIVLGKGGERLGTVADLVVIDQGCTNYVILSGPENRMYPIPMQALQLDPQKGRYVADFSLNELKKAPYFTGNNWPDLSTPQWEERIYGHYGEQLPMEMVLEEMGMGVEEQMQEPAPATQ